MTTTFDPNRYKETTHARVGPGGQVLATDILPALLSFAATDARAAGLRNVETRTMDGEALDVPEASFDVVMCRLGIIYLPDQQRALAQKSGRRRRPGSTTPGRRSS